MRTTTAGELTVLASTTRQYTPRIKVENGSGTMIDLTSWVGRVEWDHDIDQPVSGATVYFVRANGSTQSLSPLRSDSTLNREDDGVTVSAQLDIGRRVTIEVATTAVGATVLAGDYKLMFDGEIDITNFEETPVNVVCRDGGGLLVDRWVGAGYPAYQSYTVYGTTPGTGTVTAVFGAVTFSLSQAGKIANGYTFTVGANTYVVSAFSGTTTCTIPGITTFGASAFTINARPVETVMQDILDAWVGAGVLIAGTSVPTTLAVPVSPSFLVTPYKQQNMSVLDALRALAELIGWDVRFKFDEASSSFKLTLTQPDRTKVVPDYTFGPSQYFGVSRLNIDRTNIRNFISIHYFRPDLTPGTRTIANLGDPTSQARYGLRYMEIAEPDDSPINSDAEATSLITAVLADLKDPKAEQEIELDFFWPADLGDLYRHSANAVHYNANQDYAVVRVEHSLSYGSYRTRLKTRGSPAGAHIAWLPDTTKRNPKFLPRIFTTTGATLVDAENGTILSGLSTSQSTTFNGQGSMIPVATDAALFAYNAGGTATNKMWVAFTWNSFTLTRPDGTTITVPASSSLATPPSPTLSSVASGALGARTLFVRIGYMKNNMIFKVGAEASISLAASHVVKVTSPAPVAGYDRWVPLVGTSSNGEFIQVDSPFGSDFTESSTGFNSTTTTAYDNTWMPGGVTAQALPALTLEFWYAYYDIAAGFILFADRGNTSKTSASAQTQNSDGKIGLSPGGMSLTTPAGGGSGSGSPTNAGGRYL